jgi:hypothetical protein
MFFLSLFRSEKDSGGNVKQVIEALSEARADVEKQGTYGEPRLVEEGVYDKTTRVEIPVRSEYPVSPLRFDLNGDTIVEFLKTHGFSIEDFDQIEGERARIEEDYTGYYVAW